VIVRRRYARAAYAASYAWDWPLKPDCRRDERPIDGLLKGVKHHGSDDGDHNRTNAGEQKRFHGIFSLIRMLASNHSKQLEDR
jgi:hypothetical protein